ncbi:MAG: CHAT domain-containing protein [Tildeniella nuda ZEHNDER 1965/U140]|jgi:CHAT domain-containing protein|nr:CHAT domain-containing protein [Tildeniella nuda ZEHNDER 1965/U140]
MTLIRFALLFSLALSLTLTGLSPSFMVPDATVEAALPRPLLVTAEPPTGTFLRLNPERLKQTLDRGDLADAIQQIEQGWKQQYEDYFEGKLTSQVRTVDDISRDLEQITALTGKKPALIYAIPLDTQLELVLVMPGRSPLHRRISAANQEILRKTVQTFQASMVNPNSNRTTYLPVAQQLYQWMIAPLESELQAQKINTLIFCAGKDLRSVPLAALHDGQRFLIETYNLALIPAFNLLDRRLSNLQKTKVLAMGASTFKERPSLPGVPLEVSTIAGNASQSEYWLNQAFTLATLKARLAAYPFGIIHLATHAEFVPGSVDESYIQFWDTQLHLDQIRDLGLLNAPAVQLLVLSACRTALGDPQAELGFAGLAVMAGSKAAIASLWSVSDAVTPVLMTEFYRQLKTAPIKVEALRQAQIAMLKRRVNLNYSFAIAARRGGRLLPPELASFDGADVSHPYYWAAFTLIGNPW